MTREGPECKAAAGRRSRLAAIRTQYVLEHAASASLESAHREFAAHRVGGLLNEAHSCS